MRTLEELHRWVDAAPPGTSIPVASLAELLAELEDSNRAPAHNSPDAPVEASSGSWRERLWICPAETRIGISELCEALSRPRSWVYRRTSVKAEERLPHRKLGGELLFAVGEIRAWLRDHEEVVEAGPMDSTAAERRLRAM